MTASTEIKPPSTTVSITRNGRPRLAIDVIDGAEQTVRLRYPLTLGGQEVVFEGSAIAVGQYDAIIIRLTSYGYFVHVGGFMIKTDQRTATEIAEVLHGGPLPSAPHKCGVAGCEHGA